jgi:threonyl-tRNA synthetase
MIHRAPFGSMEIYSYLLEHTAGNFPLWLMPEGYYIVFEVKYEIYAKKVLDLLENHEIRALVDTKRNNW